MTNLKLQSKPFDELYTPDSAITPLLKHLPNWVQTVWCPCDTPESRIVKQLVSLGKKVIPTHISTGEDFFSPESDFIADRADMIITNPPYSNKDMFIEKCIKLGRPWALLLPLDSLCGEKRFKLYKQTGVGVITLANRVDFTGKGSNWFYNAWVCSWPEINGKWIIEDTK